MKTQLLKSLIAFLIFNATILISAKAQIFYTDVVPDVTVNTNGGVYHLDLNNDGTTDFNISIQTGNSSGSGCQGTKPYARLIITTVAGNFVATTSNSPSAIALGTAIDGAKTWSSGTINMANDYWQCIKIKQTHHWGHSIMGQWLIAFDKYLGLKFTSGGQTYYGWARLNAQVNSNATANFTIKDYAYYTLPNHTILAGESCVIAAAISVNGGTSLCKGDSTTLNLTPGYSCLWSNGETSSAITVSPVSTTTYFVTVYDSLTNCSISLSSTIIVNSTNVALLENNGTLYTYSGGNTSTYSWIDCATNLPIPGITGSIYTPPSNGTYAVVVSHNGCSDTSNCITLGLAGITENNSSNHFSIYPNPATNSVTIKFPSDEKGEMQIVNALGRVVETRNSASLRDGEIKIDVTKFPPGMYLVRWNNGENMQTQKFSVMH